MYEDKFYVPVCHKKDFEKAIFILISNYSLHINIDQKILTVVKLKMYIYTEVEIKYI